MTIGSKFWIFYQWPISLPVPFFITQALVCTKYIIKHTNKKINLLMPEKHGFSLYFIKFTYPFYVLYPLLPICSIEMGQKNYWSLEPVDVK